MSTTGYVPGSAPGPAPQQPPASPATTPAWRRRRQASLVLPPPPHDNEKYAYTHRTARSCRQDPVRGLAAPPGYEWGL
jgi:hypothetical protein